jgi:hypothetical protein
MIGYNAYYLVPNDYKREKGLQSYEGNPNISKILPY